MGYFKPSWRSEGRGECRWINKSFRMMQLKAMGVTESHILRSPQPDQKISEENEHLEDRLGGALGEAMTG